MLIKLTTGSVLDGKYVQLIRCSTYCQFWWKEQFKFTATPTIQPGAESPKLQMCNEKNWLDNLIWLAHLTVIFTISNKYTTYFTWQTLIYLSHLNMDYILLLTFHILYFVQFDECTQKSVNLGSFSLIIIAKYFLYPANYYAICNFKIRAKHFGNFNMLKLANLKSKQSSLDLKMMPQLSLI